MAHYLDRKFPLGLLAAMILAGTAPQAGARDLAGMGEDEIRVLQMRLTDGKCYSGPIDGKTSAALESAKKACPDQEPVLRIETGMHIAPINRIAADAQCHILATGSDDKTLRLWSPDGQLLRTLRLPLGEGDNGKIISVAVSPDGKLLAVSRADHLTPDSATKPALYLYELAASGDTHFLRRIEFGNRILAAVFSADDSRLALSFKGPRASGIAAGSQGVRVIDVASGAELMADADFADDAYSAAFAPDGTLYAASLDGFVRRYGADLKRTAKVAGVGGRHPFAVAVDSTGRKLALGYEDTTAVELLDPVTLRRVMPFDTRGVDNGDFGILMWSADGSRLVAGGVAEKSFGGHLHRFLRTWYPDGSRAAPDMPVSDSTVQSLAQCGNAIAFAAQDPDFGLWHADAPASVLQHGRSFDAREKVDAAFMVSADGLRLRFGLGYAGHDPVLFDLRAGAFVDDVDQAFDLAPARVTGLDVGNWRNQERPYFRGRPLALAPSETSRSLAIRNDRTGFVLGSEWHLRAFAANGSELWNVSGAGVAFGVNLARNGALAIAAYDDGTIRWHRWKDGKELLALFIDRPTRRWVAWTPSGYYMASPGGEDLIGWEVNRGWDDFADFFPASRFHAQFNRPDIVHRVLDTLDEAAAVEEANRAAPQRVAVKPVAMTLPPVLKILSLQDGMTFSDNAVELAYSLRSPAGLPVDKVDVLIDGSPLANQVPDPDGKAANAETRQTIKVALPRRDVEVSLVARAGDIVSDVVRVKLVYRAATQ